MNKRQRKGTDLPHGHSRYSNRGCRCEICTRANTEYCRDRSPRGNRVPVEHWVAPEDIDDLIACLPYGAPVRTESPSHYRRQE